MLFLTRLADLVLVNVLWLACCIPVFTIGASTAAMYRVVFNWIGQKDDTSTLSAFFHAFRQNWKQATAIWLILLGVLIALCADAWLINSLYPATKAILYAVLFLPVIAVLFTLVYVFAVLSYFENSIAQTLKNAFLLSIGHLPLTILMLALNAIPLVLFLFLPAWFIYFGFFWLLVGFSGIAYLNAKQLHPIFRSLASSRQSSEG